MKTGLVWGMLLFLGLCLGCTPSREEALQGKWVFDYLTINKAANPHPNEEENLPRFNELFKRNNILFEFAPANAVAVTTKGTTTPGTYGLLKDGTTVQVYAKGNSPDLFEITNITDTTFTVLLPNDLPFHIMHFKKTE